MSAEGKKGGGYEKYLLDTYLLDVFPEAFRPRLKGIYDYGDFANVGGWLIEAKKRERWDLMRWIREAMAKIRRHGELHQEQPLSTRFIIMFVNDKRKGLPDMAALPTVELMQLLEDSLRYREGRKEE